MLINVLYGDTDSVMIQTDIPLEELMPELNASFNDFTRQFGTENKTLHMKFEKEYDAWIQLGSKKRYIGVVDGRLDYRGIELRRSDNSDYTQWVQEEYFKQLLLTVNDQDYKLGKKYSREFYNRQIKRFNDHDSTLIPEIGIWASVRPELNYTKKKFWVAEAVKLARSKYKIEVNTSMGRVKIYFFGKGEAVAFNVDDDLPKKYYKMLDWDYHKMRCLTNPLEEFVDLITPENKGFNAIESTNPNKETAKKQTGLYQF